MPWRKTMSNKIIAVIDDDTEYTSLIEAWLKDSDIECVISNSSTKAFDVIEESKPALILLDVNMPNLNGHDMCAILKTHQDFKNIPVVFLSANSDKESEEKAYALGAKGYLSKLMEKNEFLSSIQKYLK
jgi:CheY-like chemotaxis protein